MGIVRMGPPTEIITKLKEYGKVANFIETGTYYGNTAYWASQIFERVVTIEYSPIMYQEATQKYGHLKNIEFLCGDSREMLKEVVSKLSQPSIFWLDAHWSGGNTYGENDECPIIYEIEIINSSPYDHYILIDDARLFLSPPPSPHLVEQWPDITTVINTLNLVPNRYTVIFEDVIICVPSNVKPMLSQVCQNLSTTNLKKSQAYIPEGFKLISRGVKTKFKALLSKNNKNKDF
ncbi:MAG: class I SAM-dependent methyltransferase [Xenococcaceae cyanobacterium MO_167.B27]|nr:class I SAM-dependent methyltransferase [Xenococcaceae cyanobacterium MO_167.B27]